MLFCPIVFGVCKVFNIKSEKLLFHSEYFSTKVRTQEVVHTLIFQMFLFIKMLISKSRSVVLWE